MFLDTFTIKKKIATAKEIFPRHNLDLSQTLLILQVFTGIKPAASFDYLKSPDDHPVINALNAFHLDFETLYKDGHKKIIFGKKQGVRELATIHDDVFCSNPDKKKFIKYGILLGYPSCCAKPGPFDFKPDLKNILLNSSADLPLIFHQPCSINCKQSTSQAKQALKVYHLFDTSISRKVLMLLKAPILRFNNTSYIRFNGYKLAKNVIFYQKLSPVLPNPIDENIDQQKMGEYIEFLEKLKSGDSVYFGSKNIFIFSRKNLISRSPYRLNRDYEVWNAKNK